MKVLLTGIAGFIGSAVAAKLAAKGVEVVGIDSINDYYDATLKYARLDSLGIKKGDAEKWSVPVKSDKWPELTFIRIDITDNDTLATLFKEEKFDRVVHLAAQPGVRYSLSHPKAYIENNINGFLNILEGCRHNNMPHLVYASSSSVYGLNGKIPFSEKDATQHPVSLYAATKKSNEMMAHAYSHIYGLPVTGLRFFTVYGPWGRPDMSPFLFIKGILNDEPIKVFNNGDMYRDFTFVDDIAESVSRVIDLIPEGCKDWDAQNPDPSRSVAPYRIYNVGNQNPTKLLDYISAIEKAIGKEAKKEMLPMQPGDVYQTYADSSALAEATGFSPSTPLEQGMKVTVEWFRNYFGK